MLAWLAPFIRPYRGVLTLALVLAVLATGLQTLLPVLTQLVVDELLARGSAGRISLIVGAMQLGLLGAVGATILQRRILAKVATTVDGRALDHVAGRMLRLPLAYFQTRRTADIQRRLASMREVRRVLVEDGVVALTAVFQLAVVFVALVVYSWQIGLLFLAVSPLYLLLMRYSQQRLKPALDALEESFGRYESRQLDSIKGIEVLKLSAVEDGFRQSLAADFDALADKAYRRDVTALVYDGLVSLVTLAIVALFVWVGALLVISGDLSVGEFVAVNSLVLLANAPLRILLSLWDELQLVSVQLGRLQDVRENAPEQASDAELQPVHAVDGHVQLRNVGFHHAHTPSESILRGISLDVPAGSTVALVGRSGSGKSTLLRCLAGLLTPSSGSIEYDGIDLQKLDLYSLRSKIGFAPQESYMFEGTILDNIAFGRGVPDQDRVREAAAIANAAAFIERLPLGYETRIGESGLRLSTGEQQRLSIARALYGRPSVLFLDEPTAALDSEAERAVKEGINRLRRTRTTFIAAHRLSTIRDADIICVLDGGRIVERGTHDELVARGGLYAHLRSGQLADEA
ncbi:MAG: peptidase domain-containing ABC transporter [Nocardiaceae bacterium]|nr:peptidase domain-containing ABC transporter [Nocardiaceae bacterium]